MKSRKSTNRSKGMILYKIKTFTLLLLVNPFPSSLATCLEAPFQTNPFQLFLVERVLSFGGNLFFFAFSLMTESTIFNGIVPLFLRGARLDYSAPPSLSSTLPPSHTSFFPLPTFPSTICLVMVENWITPTSKYHSSLPLIIERYSSLPF